MSDVQAAAERLRRYTAGDMSQYHDGENMRAGGVSIDRATLADAWLAEHPADSATDLDKLAVETANWYWAAMVLPSDAPSLVLLIRAALTRAAADARRETLEEAAKVAEETHGPFGHGWPNASKAIAAAIRRLT